MCLIKSCDSVTTFWKEVFMKDEIMLSDTFDHVYQEIDTLIKPKKIDVKRVVDDAM